MSVRRRIALLDEIRGFCILCMVFYHAFYLFGSFSGSDICLRLFHIFEPVQVLFASVFICISGICTNFSHNVLRRGLYLCGIAGVISVVSILLLPKLGFDAFQDKFGILHFLGVSMVLTALLKKPMSRIEPKTGILICIGLFAVTFLLTEKITVRPDWLFPLGFRSADFYSADYFPLLPNIFTFWIGTCIGQRWQSDPPAEWVWRVHVRFYSFIGRYTLWIYLLHIPVLLIIIKIMERI